jgi:peptidoglycan/LPS O-acetylase OafA/YrhL
MAVEQALATDERALASVSSATPRLHWIDWLRVAAIAGVFLYHTFRPFDSTGWHVKNAETSGLIGGVQIFFSTFGLAVLFLLAGAGVQFALRRRSPGTFLRERTARLLVPFVVGTLALSPIQAFIEAKSRGTATMALPDYVRWWSDAVGSAVSGGITPTVFGLGYHLWFLGFLFAFSVIGLPVFLVLRRRSWADAIERLARRVSITPGSTVAFAVPIAVLLFGSAVLGIAEHGWNEFGQYFAYFVIGFLFVADSRFLPAVRRDAWVAAGVSVLTTVGLIGLNFGEWLTTDASRGLEPRSITLVLLFVVEGWASTLVVLNIGMRLAALQRPVSQRLGDAVLPIYVFHQPVILAVAFFVVQWPLGILPKWLVVFGLSAAITLALVALGLRARVTRVLLGARAEPAGPGVPAPDRAAAGGPPAAHPTLGARHA